MATQVRTGLIARKLGMTRLFNDDGSTTPVTVSLALADGTATGGGTDFGPALEISSDGGATWVASNNATFAPFTTSLLVRTPITDGAASKPWVYRFKDLRAWWQSPHFNRPGGVESGLATAWVPQSKPIRFTELGCPAIDRGTNQPNVFFDPKSSESFTPYFSRGWRDDAIQRAYLEASYLHWGGAANNPPPKGAAAPKPPRPVPRPCPKPPELGAGVVNVTCEVSTTGPL